MVYKLQSCIAHSAITFFIITAPLNLFTLWRFGIGSDHGKFCSHFVKYIGVAYNAGKLSMYLYFIIKLHQTYNGSTYAYNKTSLIALGTIAIVTFIAIIAGNQITTTMSIIYYPEIGPFAINCRAHYSWIFLIVIGIMDTFIQMCYLYMFIKPLISLTKDLNQSTNEKRRQLLFTATKAIIITVIATVSTMIFCISVVFMESTILAPFEIVINIVSILLMTPYCHDWMYTILCCGMICIVQRVTSENVDIGKSIMKRTKTFQTHTKTEMVMSQIISK